MIIRLLAGTTLALLAGCAAVPNVVYHQLSPGTRSDTWVPFRLTDSIIVIGAPGAAKGDDTGSAPVDLARTTVRCPGKVCGPVAAAAVPTDYQAALFALEPHSRKLVSTVAAPAYFANSLRLKTLTVEAKDHRLEAVNTIAAITSGVAHLATGGMDLSNSDPTDQTAQLVLPVTIALADLRCTAATCPAASPAAALPGNPDWTYTFTYGDEPASGGLLPRAQMDSVHGAMVASACRPARLELHHADQKVTVVLRVTVADPDWLVTVPFPSKGAMTFHTLCGVDVQPQSVTDVGVDAMANAFINGVTHLATPK